MLIALLAVSLLYIYTSAHHILYTHGTADRTGLDRWSDSIVGACLVWRRWEWVSVPLRRQHVDESDGAAFLFFFSFKGLACRSRDLHAYIYTYISDHFLRSTLLHTRSTMSFRSLLDDDDDDEEISSIIYYIYGTVLICM